ncbi:MAG: hypothetical protein ACK5LT_13300 [Lachnospirales bacterium]
MKKILFFMLFTALAFGCQFSPKKEPKDKSLNSKYNEHLNISIGFWDIQDMVNNTKGDEILSLIEKKFNITISPLSVNWNDYKEHYQILSATNNLPDLFASVTMSSSDNNGFSSLDKLIYSKSIRSLPDDLSPYPNVENIIKMCSPIYTYGGKYYALPRTSFQDIKLSSSDASMLIRKDWMENLNIAAPQSLEKFIELTSAFAHKDPDGNGLDDTIGYNVNNRIALGKWLMLGIAPKCNVYSWIEEDGKYIPSYITKDFEKVITAYRKLYNVGGLDPNFYVKKPTDSLSDFASGKLGALEYKSSPSSVNKLQKQWDLYQRKPFQDCVGTLQIFPAEDGNYYSNTSSIYWSESLFSSKVDDKKMDRILSLYDYLLSEEGTNLIKYGIENVDYVKENGEYKCTVDVKNISLSHSLFKKYPSLYLFNSLSTWGGTRDDFRKTEINNLRFGNHAVHLANEDLKWNLKNTIPVKRPFNFILTPKESTEYFTTEAIVDDFTKIIIGKSDPIEMWHKTLDEYYKNGLNEYIERQNQLYLDYLKTQEK